MYNLGSYQDECINDILLAIWDHVACYDASKNSFKNWIAILAKYTSLNYVKKYKRLSDSVELDSSNLVTQDNNISKLIQQDIREDLEHVLSGLKEKDRIIFTELYFNDKSMDEVCWQTGMNKNYIYNRLSRGKKKLRALWERRMNHDGREGI